MATPSGKWWQVTVLRADRRFALGVALLSAFLVELVVRVGALEPIEQLYSDYYHQRAGVRQVPERVVLVNVDDASLGEHQDTPLVFWTPHFARAAGVLGEVGALAVGLDFLPAITPEGWLRRIRGLESTGLHEFDLPFRQSLQAGRLVLVAMHGTPGADGRHRLTLPHQDYLLSLPEIDLPRHIGYADLLTDADGGVRRYVARPQPTLAEDEREGAPQLSFAALLATRARPALVAEASPTPIAFAGPPGTFPALSIRTLLRPDAAQLPEVQALRGKIVIIGATYLGMTADAHFTPYSRSLFGGAGRLMAGPEIQANIVETLIGNRRIEALVAPARLALAGVLMTFAALAFLWLPPTLGAGGLALLAGLCVLIGWLAFLADAPLPVAAMQLGLLNAFLVVQARRLTRDARDKARLRQVFSQYVSDELVEQIMRLDRAPDLGGEERQVTVLFSDIRNFTSISERLDAHEVVEFLNAYFERACQPILRHGGSIDKFIGDAIMAEFGAPVAAADHARRALLTALEMDRVARDFALWMATRFAGRDLPPFAIGIGVHSGPAVVGNIGCSRRMEYTAIGDTVNLASRLEGATKEFGSTILASRQTVVAAGEGFVLGAPETIAVKGRQQMVEVLPVLGSAVPGEKTS